MTSGILIYTKERFSLIYHVGLKGFSKDNNKIAISCYILVLKGIYTISPEIKQDYQVYFMVFNCPKCAFKYVKIMKKIHILSKRHATRVGWLIFGVIGMFQS